MKIFSFLFLFASFLLYLAAFAAHIISLKNTQADAHRRAAKLMAAAFRVATLYFISEALRMESFLPVFHLAQALAFFAWSIAFVYLFLLARIQRDSFGLVLTPLLAILTGSAALAFQIKASASAPYPDSFFIIHIISAFFAYACFTIAFAAGVLYLIQQHELKTRRAGTFYHRLPALEPLEKLIFQPMAMGVVLLSAAVIVGFFWSHAQFGEYWLTDPKTVSTLLIIFAYGLILYLRYGLAVRGKRVIVFGLIAFGLMIFMFVGLRFVSGSHNFLQ